MWWREGACGGHVPGDSCLCWFVCSCSLASFAAQQRLCAHAFCLQLVWVALARTDAEVRVPCATKPHLPPHPQVGGFFFMHKEDLKRMCPEWLSITVDVREDPESWRLTGDQVCGGTACVTQSPVGSARCMARKAGASRAGCKG